jgi:hypothetical protein
MSRRLPKSNEEKVAEKIAEIVANVNLDLDSVGIYLARIRPSISYNRLMLIAESAEFEKESIDVRTSHHPLF